MLGAFINTTVGGVDAFEPGVESSDGALLVAAEFFTEFPDIGSEVAIFEIVFGESGEPRKFGSDFCAFSPFEVGSLSEGQPVITKGEFAGLVDQALEITGEFAVVVGSRGVSWEVDRIGEIIALVESKSLETEDTADENETAEADTAFDEVAAESGCAGCSIAFTGEVEGGIPAFLADEEEADKFTDGFNVSFDAPVFFGGFIIFGAAESRADGVDKNEVAELEPVMGVID